MKKIVLLTLVLTVLMLLSAESIMAGIVYPWDIMSFRANGTVNPNYGGNWAPDVYFTGTAKYSFYWQSITGTDVNVTEAFLLVEDNIFVEVAGKELKDSDGNPISSVGVTDFKIGFFDGVDRNWSATLEQYDENGNLDLHKLSFSADSDADAVKTVPLVLEDFWITIQFDYQLVSSSPYEHGDSMFAGETLPGAPLTWEWNDADGRDLRWAQTFGLKAYGQGQMPILPPTIPTYNPEATGAAGGSTGVVIPEPGMLLLLGGGLIGLASYGRLRLSRKKK